MKFVYSPTWGLLDKEFCIGRDVPPTTPAPGTKRCRTCASWRPWGALIIEANKVLTDLLGLPDEKFVTDLWASREMKFEKSREIPEISRFLGPYSQEKWSKNTRNRMLRFPDGGPRKLLPVLALYQNGLQF